MKSGSKILGRLTGKNLWGICPAAEELEVLCQAGPTGGEGGARDQPLFPTPRKNKKLSVFSLSARLGPKALRVVAHPRCHLGNKREGRKKPPDATKTLRFWGKCGPRTFPGDRTKKPKTRAHQRVKIRPRAQGNRGLLGMATQSFSGDASGPQKGEGCACGFAWSLGPGSITKPRGISFLPVGGTNRRDLVPWHRG